MTRSELIKSISAQYPHLYATDVERLVSTIINVMKKSLLDGRRIELRTFGVFGVKQNKPRLARNPVTGAQVHLDERSSLFFKPGKDLKEQINKE
jgi:integration host factor subunit beta